MGTNGCVAVGTLEKWVGVYNHYDSYPTRLGQEVWQYVRGIDLIGFGEELLKYDSWEHFKNKGVCPRCQEKVGSPHSFKEHGEHEHNEFPFSKYHLTQDTADPVFIEWIYLIDPDEHMMHIFKNRGKHEKIKDYDKDDERVREGEWLVWYSGYVMKYYVKHELVESISLSSAEPNWEELWSTHG
jgi:hypothetical protein